MPWLRKLSSVSDDMCPLLHIPCNQLTWSIDNIRVGAIALKLTCPRGCSIQSFTLRRSDSKVPSIPVVLERWFEGRAVTVGGGIMCGVTSVGSTLELQNRGSEFRIQKQKLVDGSSINSAIQNLPFSSLGNSGTTNDAAKCWEFRFSFPAKAFNLPFRQSVWHNSSPRCLKCRQDSNGDETNGRLVLFFCLPHF